MPAPFQSYLNPAAGQYYTPGANAYGSGDQNPNPNPVSTSMQNPLGWANENTYAPFQTPNGVTGQNPSFSGAGGWTNGASPNLFSNNFDSFYNAATMGMFGNLGKKWSMPDISSPSYQGTLFNPDSGPYAQAYGANYSQPYGGANSQPVTTPSQVSSGQVSSSSGSYPGAAQYNGSQYAGTNGLQSSQSFIGQSPYGVAGGTYVPGQGSSSASYGGYGNYGGYANSGAGMQPYMPGSS